jgi:hypothetical protein
MGLPTILMMEVTAVTAAIAGFSSFISHTAFNQIHGCTHSESLTLQLACLGIMFNQLTTNN